MLQACALRVGLLTSGALAIRFFGFVPDVSTARFGGSRKSIGGRAGGAGHTVGS
jgi:hypothetical protein